MKVFHLISRLIIGIVFMFSGFVKGIDPLGTAYRFEDYFIVWGTDWMIPFAVILSVFASTMEFVLGFVVLFNLKPKVNAWLLLGVMLFFTGLTLNDAITNPVPDCGCFGDAITLTNWQTFYKNVVLMVPTIILLVYRNKTKDRYSNLVSYGSAGIVVLLFTGLSLYCYLHLPVIDFMDWKVGRKMYAEKTLPVKYFLTYRNKATGETQEYLSPDYPFNDSVWMSQWEFVDQRIDDPNEPIGGDVQITDTDGNDVTEMLVRNPDYQFLLISWDFEKATAKGLTDMIPFAAKAEADGYNFAAVTSTLGTEVDTISKLLNLDYQVYQADDVSLKTMVRSNPGLILLKDGVVIGKWSHCDFKEYDEFRKDVMAAQ